MSNIRAVNLNDATGNPIGSLGGAINVHMAGVHNHPINDSFHRHTGTDTTLSVATTIGATSITVVSVAGFAVGNYIQFISNTLESTYTIILSIVGSVININRPVGHVHAIGTTVAQIVTNAASVAGSMASPQSYKINPAIGQVWHVERLSFQMSHSSAGDIGLFGGITALANGCILRKYNADGTYDTYTLWRSNADIFLDLSNIQFVTRSGGGGTYGTIGIGSFTDIGVTIKLDGTNGEYLELLIQDNITTLGLFELHCQGHLETA